MISQVTRHRKKNLWTLFIQLRRDGPPLYNRRNHRQRCRGHPRDSPGISELKRFSLAGVSRTINYSCSRLSGRCHDTITPSSPDEGYDGSNVEEVGGGVSDNQHLKEVKRYAHLLFRKPSQDNSVPQPSQPFALGYLNRLLRMLTVTMNTMVIQVTAMVLAVSPVGIPEGIEAFRIWDKVLVVGTERNFLGNVGSVQECGITTVRRNSGVCSVLTTTTTTTSRSLSNLDYGSLALWSNELMLFPKCLTNRGILATQPSDLSLPVTLKYLDDGKKSPSKLHKRLVTCKYSERDQVLANPIFSFEMEEGTSNATGAKVTRKFSSNDQSSNRSTPQRSFSQTSRATKEPPWLRVR
nr:hypothetical protein HmN_000999200 [Hymenolepis microstoma]